MKYFVLIFDGMADRPIAELGGRTPMEAADKPNLDYISSHGLVGTVSNVPESMRPESDTANLAIMSYDPLKYSNGRSPLEAVSLGIEMQPEDTAIRCNLVTLSDEEEYTEKTMVDHSSDEISTEEARVLIEYIQSKLGSDTVRFYPGVSYRHCSIWKNADDKFSFTPPHDIIGRKIGEYLPSGDEGTKYFSVMEQSYKLLSEHEINRKRVAAGKRPANSLWFWSPGKKPALPDFRSKWGLNAAAVSAVDLIKGIAICAGMKSIDVEGATGNINTNYTGKANAAINAFKDGFDYVYVHVEAPDECGHRGETENKVKSIEYIDKRILGPVLEFLENSGDSYKVLALPDHPTPIEIRTHSREPVPFVIFSNELGFDMLHGATIFSEKNATETGLYVDNGIKLLPLMISISPDKIKKIPKNAPNPSNTQYQSDEHNHDSEVLTDGDTAGTTKESTNESNNGNCKENTNVVLDYTSAFDKSIKPGGISNIAASLREWIEMLLLACCFVLLIFAFIARPARVIGASMESTLTEGDTLIVSDLLYSPEYGDIVVFQSHTAARTDPIVKRVIATAGQWIDIDFLNDYTMTVKIADTMEGLADAKPLDESGYAQFLTDERVTSVWEFPLQVPEGSLFVMGDNRNHSLDSRSSAIGFVERDNIIGRVLLRVMPFGKFGAVK